MEIVGRRVNTEIIRAVFNLGTVDGRTTRGIVILQKIIDQVFNAGDVSAYGKNAASIAVMHVSFNIQNTLY